jgi:hypothetical protein
MEMAILPRLTSIPMVCPLVIELIAEDHGGRRRARR